jgi:hypothetical protein
MQKKKVMKKKWGKPKVKVMKMKDNLGPVLTCDKSTSCPPDRNS